MNNFFDSRFLLLGLMVVLSPTFAEQRLDADERVPQKAIISKSSLSRISIDGGRIKNVKWLDGELDIQKDAGNGQVFVRATTNKTTSLFINSDDGKTYLLLLSPTATTGDSIIIDAKAKERQAQMMAVQIPQPPQAVSYRTNDYVRALKQLMTAMMNGTVNSMGLRSTTSYLTVPLWQNTLFVQTKQYTAADMKAEVYTLTNTGAETLVLKEQEFYREGVYAVSARKHILLPGEMTEIFIIRKLGN